MAPVEAGKWYVITRNIVVGEVPALYEGQHVFVEKIEPDPTRPEYQYVVHSKELGKLFLLSEMDLIENADYTPKEHAWNFHGLITDLTLDHPPIGISQSQLTISGNTVTIRLGVAGDKQVAQFNADEIVEVLFQDGSPGVGSAALFGILGGLVGGQIQVVVILRNGCRLMFPCGWRTNSNRQRAARIAGEIKQAIGLQAEKTQDETVTSSKSESDTKKCPYCAEEIKSEAIKCKHCGSDLS